MLTRRELAALALAFLVTLPVVTQRLYASDEVQYFSWLRSLAFDRDVDFENEYRYFHQHAVPTGGFFATFLADDAWNEHGRRINFAPIGSAVLWAPFYAAGHVAARLSSAPADGFSQPYISAVAIGSAFYGMLAVALSAAIARRVVGRGLSASTIVALGTPLVFYTWVAPVFAHATSAFAVSLFLWTWLRVRGRWHLRDVVLLGLAGGLMAMVREQDAFFVIGPAIDFVTFLIRPQAAGLGPQSSAVGPRAAGLGPRAPGLRPQQGLGVALAGAAAFLVAFTPQLVAYKALNGHFGPTTYVARKMYWTSPHAFEVLISTGHGLFFWTPLALVALGGLVWLATGAGRRLAGAAPDARWLAALALVMFVAQVYISGAVDSWTVAGSFGQRRFVATTPLLVIGLAAGLAAARGRARVVLRTAIALCVWWNVALVFLFGTHRMDRQRLTLPENVRAVFLDVPFDAPVLAWRYLTDRASFYRQPRQ